MKQETKQKLFFVAGAVFGLALLGASVGIIAAQTTWSPPPGPFPAANVYAPLDTGPSEQTKLGRLELGKGLSERGWVLQLQPNQSLSAEGGQGAFYPNYDTVGAYLYTPTKFQIVANEGVLLPKLSADPATTAAGSIYYNTTSNSVKLRNSSGWTEIGSGGESHWSMVSGTLTYGGGDVKIASVTQGTQTGFWNTGSIGANGKNTFAFIPKAQAVETGKALACDTSRFYKECPQGTGAFYGGGFKDGSTPTNGSEGTDEFAECPTWSGLSGELYIFAGTAECRYYTSGPEGGELLQHTGYPSYRRMIYEYETRNVGSPTDTATLSVGNISVGNIDVSGKIRGQGSNSPFVTGFVEGYVGNWEHDDLEVGNLPSGYDGTRCVTFLQGFRDEHCAWNACKTATLSAGMLAACWLGGSGDNRIYGSYAGDDTGDNDGVLRCGYLCW